MKYSEEKCDEIMDTYIGLEKGDKVPAAITLHLLTCKKCRKEVQTLNHAKKLVTKPLHEHPPVEVDSITDIMKKLDINYAPKKHSVPLIWWVIIGIILIIAMVAMCLVVNRLSFRIFRFILLITITGSIIAYAMLFIGYHIDLFIKPEN